VTASPPEPTVPSATWKGWFAWITASLVIVASCIGPDRGGGIRVPDPWTPTTVGVIESIGAGGPRTQEYTLHTGERLIIPNGPCDGAGLSKGKLLFYAEDDTEGPRCATALPGNDSEYIIHDGGYTEDRFLVLITTKARIPLAPTFVDCGENDWTGRGGAQFVVNEKGQATRVVC
jgi:hypothetical protein